VYQRDYILRLIEHLGRTLLVLRDRILGRQREPHATVQDEIRAIAARAGLDLDVARAVDPATLRLLMSFAGDLDPARCWLTAELLYLEGLDKQQDNTVAARRDLTRALDLYLMLTPEWQPFPELPPSRERIAEIEQLLAGLPSW
jgi:hypothetical protein